MLFGISSKFYPDFQWNDVGMGVAAAKAVKPANPSPLAAAEEEKESVKPEKPKESDVEYTMDSEPDLADEPDDDNLDMPNAADER